MTNPEKFDILVCVKGEKERMKTSCVIVLVLSCWVCPLNAGQAFPSKDKVEAIAKTIYHEARGEAEYGMRAVASTLYNRAVRKGEVTVYSLYAEAKRKYQFSCWNGKRDLPKGKDAAWETSMEIAIELYLGNFNPVHGHTHYYAYKKCNPKWARTAKSAGVKIGNHKFMTVK